MEHVDGVPIVVLPGVFNPCLFRTGASLARTLRIAPCGPTTTVLDMGTGSGIGAVFAARRGARVVAVDLNPEAVRCANLNAHINGLSDWIDVRLGDLFAPVGDERFDLILFNPPFYSGAPRDITEMAWRSDGVFDRFLAELPPILAPGGRALVVLSTDAEGPLRALAGPHAMRMRVLWQRNYLNERLAAIELRPEHDGRRP